MIRTLPPSVKGMPDLLPQELARHEEVKARARGILRKAGFVEIRTPILEHAELFQRSLGVASDIVHKEMYTLKDLSGRELVLRPEGTAALVRAILEHHLYHSGEELRFYYEGPMFRYEQPQKGRLRQFHQMGAEVIGTQGAEVDLELVALAQEILSNLELGEFQLLWNNIGCPRCRPPYREALIKALSPWKEKLCETCQRRLKENPLRILDCKQPQCREIVRAHAPEITPYLCEACSKHRERFEAGLRVLGIPGGYDPYLVRGLDYYTRTVFEFISPELAGQNTLLAGGRYDALFSLLGEEEIPAAGFALGVERVLVVSRISGKAPEPPLILWIPLGEEGRLASLPFILALRQEGFSCMGVFHKESLRSALRYAGKLGSRYVVMDGEEERRAGQVKIRDMEKHEEITIPRTLSALTGFFASLHAL